MAHTGTNYLIPVVLSAAGTLTAADGKDLVTIDFDAYIWRVSANIGVNGTSSGNTDFVVERTDAATSTAGDLWTPASGCGRIAHDSTNLYLEWDWENANLTGYASGQLFPPTGCRIKKGDQLKLNINAIPGGSDSADLKVTLWLKPVVD